MVDLVQFIAQDAFDVLGLCVLHPHCDSGLLETAASRSAVHLGRKACERIISQADILVFWATSATTLPLPPISVYVSHGGGTRLKIVRELAAQGVHFVAVSQWAARMFPPEVTPAIIHNGVDVARLRPLAGREKTRARWGIEPDDVVIGYVGRASREKGAISAALAARHMGPPYRSLFVGTTPDPIRVAIRDYDPRAVFVEPIELGMGDAYAVMDIFMLASQSEGHSLALTEAWLCAVPAVATRVGIVPELEKQHGRLVTPVEFDDTPQNLVAAVRAAMEDQETVERAKSFAEAEFTAEASGKRWSAYLTALCRANDVAGVRV